MKERRERERERERDFSCFEISFYVKLILLYDRKYRIQINEMKEMKKKRFRQTVNNLA